MKDSGPDDLFSELMEGHEELQAFLDRLRARVPAALFRMYTADGRLLSPDTEPPLPPTEGVFPLGIAPEDGIVRISQAPGNLHAVAVPQLAAILLIDLPVSYGDCAGNPALPCLIDSCIDLALLAHEQDVLRMENQQIQRQIGVLNHQHYKLIEDNYRQYRLLREREKEYARMLENEIARQTAELREANNQLEESSRLKSEFLANMSHELRTPLNAIIGFSELLAETGLSGEQVEYSDTIRTASNSLLALINDILDLSKIEAGKVDLESEPFNPAEVISRVLGLFETQAREKGVAFTSRVDGRLPVRVLGDANRLQQVLVNLAGNAVKFTSEGAVELRAEPAGRQGGEILIRFSVKDTGIGIPLERQKAVFEKFIQADGSTTRKYGGTGLGLAICCQLVNLMRGEIRLESTPGRGSSFIVTVPLIDRPQEIPAEDENPEVPAGEGKLPHPAARGRATVLLVEDNPVNQKLAGIMLCQQNCQVLTAVDGIDALEKLKANRCDLILMDIQMPRLDGLAATRKIREIEGSAAGGGYAGLSGRPAPVPIIGLTAHARKEDEQASREAGMNDFLTKPIRKENLRLVLEKYLAGLQP